MNGRSPWLVGLAFANLVFLVAAAFLLRGRLDALDARVEQARGRPEAGAARPAPTAPAAASEDLLSRVQKLSDDAYEYYSQVAGDLHELKRTLKQVHAGLRRLQQSLAQPGAPVGAWGLAPLDRPLTPEVLAVYRKDAESWGVRIEEGRVVVRGVLNMSPWSTMPIEYFLSRWPEAGHETLIHLLGPAPLDETLSPDRLRGLVTAVYKAMVVAGFEAGSPARVEPPAPGEKEPRWVPPTGDAVHVGVRYELGGRVHLARATDWVVDPSTRAVLPHASFRFTGSLRIEDHETGDEQVSAEAGGLVVSVYMNPNALVEIVHASSLNNAYQYNHLRIPKPVILRLENGVGRVEGERDRARRALRLFAVEAGGARKPIEKAPTLLVRGEDGNDRAQPFAPVEGGWEVVDAALGKGDWRVRLEANGELRDTAGFEPLYLDIVLSKAPIVPEGDGARPLEPVDLPADLPRGTGRGG